MRDEYKFSLSLFSYHALTEDTTGLQYVYFLYNKSRQHSTLPRHHREEEQIDLQPLKDFVIRAVTNVTITEVLCYTHIEIGRQRERGF